jgi:hypothetical protein
MAKVFARLDLKHPKKDGTCAVYIFTTVKSVPIYLRTGTTAKTWMFYIQVLYF